MSANNDGGDNGGDGIAEPSLEIKSSDERVTGMNDQSQQPLIGLDLSVLYGTIRSITERLDEQRSIIDELREREAKMKEEHSHALDKIKSLDETIAKMVQERGDVDSAVKNALSAALAQVEEKNAKVFAELRSHIRGNSERIISQKDELEDVQKRQKEMRETLDRLLDTHEGSGKDISQRLDRLETKVGETEEGMSRAAAKCSELEDACDLLQLKTEKNLHLAGGMDGTRDIAHLERLQTLVTSLTGSVRTSLSELSSELLRVENVLGETPSDAEDDSETAELEGEEDNEEDINVEDALPILLQLSAKCRDTLIPMTFQLKSLSLQAEDSLNATVAKYSITHLEGKEADSTSATGETEDQQEDRGEESTLLHEKVAKFTEDLALNKDQVTTLNNDVNNFSAQLTRNLIQCTKLLQAGGGGALDIEQIVEAAGDENAVGSGSGSGGISLAHLRNYATKEALIRAKETIGKTNRKLGKAVNASTKQTEAVSATVHAMKEQLRSIHTRVEIVNNSVSAMDFKVKQVLELKEDIMDEMESTRASLAELAEKESQTSEESRGGLQEHRQKIDAQQKKLSEAMAALVKLEMKEGKSAKESKEILERHAHQIAHIVATKADNEMLQSGLESKASVAIENNLNEFIRRVANELGERDQRHTMVASSHRAALEARLLKVVTRALSRIQQQQHMLAEVIGPYNTAMAGLQYKCLTCDRPSAPSLDERALQATASVMSRSAPNLRQKVDHRYMAHTRQTLRTQGAGFRIHERPRTSGGIQR
eukprot:g1491.t1